MNNFLTQMNLSCHPKLSDSMHINTPVRCCRYRPLRTLVYKGRIQRARRHNFHAAGVEVDFGRDLDNLVTLDITSLMAWARLANRFTIIYALQSVYSLISDPDVKTTHCQERASLSCK